MDEDHVFRAFMPLISHTIRKYFPEYVYDDDVFQEASIGLLRAIRNYDESRKIMFSTFAVACIRNGIKTYLRDKRVKEHPGETVFIEDYLKPNHNRDGVSAAVDAFHDELGSDTTQDLICYIDFRDFYDTLDADQKIIVRMLIRGNTTQEISEVFGITRQAISLRVGTIRKLYRNFMKGA